MRERPLNLLAGSRSLIRYQAFACRSGTMARTAYILLAKGRIFQISQPLMKIKNQLLTAFEVMVIFDISNTCKISLSIYQNTSQQTLNVE